MDCQQVICAMHLYGLCHETPFAVCSLIYMIDRLPVVRLLHVLFDSAS